MLPSDTKLLLTKNYSEIIIFERITNLTHNCLKISFFPGHFESANYVKNYEKLFSGNYFRSNFVSEGISPGKHDSESVQIVKCYRGSKKNTTLSFTIAFLVPKGPSGLRY